MGMRLLYATLTYVRVSTVHESIIILYGFQEAKLCTLLILFERTIVNTLNLNISPMLYFIRRVWCVFSWTIFPTKGDRMRNTHCVCSHFVPFVLAWWPCFCIKRGRVKYKTNTKTKSVMGTWNISWIDYCLVESMSRREMESYKDLLSCFHVESRLES